MKRLFFLFLTGFVFLAISAAHSVAAEDSSHNELRTLRTQIIDAINKGDITAVLQHVHPDVVVTWQNAEVCRGATGLKEFFDRKGRKMFKGYKVPPTPDELTILHGGDTGISFGHVVGHYTLFGKELEFTSRWTATLVKQEGRWLLASYHVSFNALDNPLLNAAEKSLFWVAVGAAVVGLLIGVFIGRRRLR